VQWKRAAFYAEFWPLIEGFRMSSMNSSGGGGGGCGCLSFVVFILLLWALVFGVSWGGKHHEINCSQNRGVELN